jgi:hypothetical protein
MLWTKTKQPAHGKFPTMVEISISIFDSVWVFDIKKNYIYFLKISLSTVERKEKQTIVYGQWPWSTFNDPQ